MTQTKSPNCPYRPCVGVMLVKCHGTVFVGSVPDRDQDAMA